MSEPKYIPRYLTTIDEIEALPIGAVLVDNTNHSWTKGRTQWWSSHPYDAQHLNNPMKMETLLLVFEPSMRDSIDTPGTD